MDIWPWRGVMTFDRKWHLTANVTCSQTSRCQMSHRPCAVKYPLRSTVITPLRGQMSIAVYCPSVKRPQSNILWSNETVVIGDPIKKIFSFKRRIWREREQFFFHAAAVWRFFFLLFELSRIKFRFSVPCLHRCAQLLYVKSVNSFYWGAILYEIECCLVLGARFSYFLYYFKTIWNWGKILQELEVV